MEKTNEQPKVLQIELASWGRGIQESSYLFNPSSEKKCCLGFYCLAEGMTKHQIQWIGNPLNFNLREFLPASLQDFNPHITIDNYDIISDFISGAICLNDTPVGHKFLNAGSQELGIIISDEDRQQRLSELFLKYRNIRLEFV